MIARRVYGTVRAVSLLATAAFVVVFGRAAVAGIRPADAAFLIGALAVACGLGALRAPAARFERSARPAPESDRVALLASLLLVVLVAEGWLWAAALDVVAFLLRPPGLRRRPLRDRVLDALLRVPPWWALGFAAPFLRAAVTRPVSVAGTLSFVAAGAALVLLVDLLWIDTLAALRQNRSLMRILARHASDRASLAIALGESAWAYVAARVALHDGPAMGIAVLVPLVVLALTLARFARANARLHRLRLSRAAVDAMLRANDPQPQMASLLESIDPRIVRESVEIAAFGRAGRDRWSRVVRFGAIPSAELGRLGGRALAELQVTGEDVVEDHVDGTVHAYAARDAEDRLRGALLVFRGAGAPGSVEDRQYERAAVELGPLLGEYGAIAATRTAAAVDTLTGLPNRRGVSRAFDEAMAYVRGGGRYAVLLLDVDHFKSINDLLGHQTGDRVLARIGRIIADNVRGFDVAGRFGGEEFVVLLRDAEHVRAMEIAERLRAAIEAGGLAHADGKPVTVSIGVAYVQAGDGSADVVERADRALYRAKNAGRNRVVEAALIAV